MKLTSRIALLAIVSTGLASAATVSSTASANVDFTTNETSYTFALNSTWTASIGYYSGAALTPTSTFSNITSGWVNVATANFATAALPVGGVAGWFNIPATFTDGSATSTIAGKNVQLWITNQTNGKDGNMILTSVSKFASDLDVPSGVITAISDTQVSNWTINSDLGGKFTTGGVNAGYGGSYVVGAVAAIPEPSAALLGAFGAIGLLRRRRN